MNSLSLLFPIFPQISIVPSKNLFQNNALPEQILLGSLRNCHVPGIVLKGEWLGEAVLGMRIRFARPSLRPEENQWNSNLSDPMAVNGAPVYTISRKFCAPTKYR